MKRHRLSALLGALFALSPVLPARADDSATSQRLKLPPPPDVSEVVKKQPRPLEDPPPVIDPTKPVDIPLPPGEEPGPPPDPSFTPEGEPPLPDYTPPPAPEPGQDLPADDLPADDLPADDLPAGDLPADQPLPDGTPDPALPGDTSVPRGELSPTPAAGAAGDPASLSDRGPMFRIPGAEAWDHARKLGFHFTPAGGMGRRDGIHTVAAQYPSILTSEVHGPRMTQLCPPLTWNTPSTNNTFFMFCDANFNAVRLNDGWKVRGIQLKGPNWQWVVCPKSGAGTVSFSVRLVSEKTARTGTVVTLTGITLEGPVGATDWKAAFPDLNNRAPVAQQR